MISYLTLQVHEEGQGSYVHVTEIIRGLRKRGCEVQLFHPIYRTGSSAPGILRRLLEYARVQLNLWFRGLRNADVVYIRAHFASLLTVLVARMLGLKVILELNSVADEVNVSWSWARPFGGMLRFLLRKQLQWSTVVVVVTPALREWVRREVDHPTIEVIPNGANIEIFNPSATTKLQLPKRYVVFFGALSRWQGLDILLRATNRPEWPTDVSLVILGDGTEVETVREAARQNSLIVYCGSLPYEKVAGVVAGSLAGISPKNNLGRHGEHSSPLKVYETLACGIPAIVTDFQGQSELVRKYECGIVVPPDDARALAEAVRYIRNNEDERKVMGRRGQRAVETEHSWDQRAEMTYHVIAGLWGDAHASR